MSEEVEGICARLLASLKNGTIGDYHDRWLLGIRSRDLCDFATSLKFSLVDAENRLRRME